MELPGETIAKSFEAQLLCPNLADLSAGYDDHFMVSVSSVSAVLLSVLDCKSTPPVSKM